MNRSVNQIAASWLGLVGVAIGLAVAIGTDQLLSETQVDRPLVFAGVTGGIALFWLMAVRLAFGPTPARARIPKRSEP